MGAQPIFASEQEARENEALRVAQEAYQEHLDGNREIAFKSDAIDWKAAQANPPPERDWAIKEWWGMGHVTLMAGLGGVGKSLVGQQIGTSVAMGVSWIGDTSTPRKCLYWAGEDDEDELIRRQAKICAKLNVPMDDLHNRFVVHSLASVECALLERSEGSLVVTKVAKQLREQINDQQIDAVILDNISVLYGGGENDRHEVTRFMKVLAMVAKDRKPAMLLMGHTAKAAGSEFSGSTAWENAARARWHFGVTRPDQDVSKDDAETAPTDVRYLSKRKANYSAKDLRTMHYNAGAFEVEPYETRESVGQSGGFLASMGRKRADRIVMRGITRLTELNYPVSDARGRNYLPSLVMEHQMSEGLQAPDVKRAMIRLIGEGVVERRNVQSKNRGETRIQLVLTEVLPASTDDPD